MNKTPQQPQKLVEVTLAKPHTHARRPYAAGEKLSVTEPVRDWMASNQIIVNAPTAPKEGAK